MFKILEKVFLQALQKNSYWGIRASTNLNGSVRKFRPLGRQVQYGVRSRILRGLVSGFSGGLGRGFCVSSLPKSLMWSGFLAMRPYHSCTPVPTGAELRRIAFLRRG
jgi:hypothetical protein